MTRPYVSRELRDRARAAIDRRTRELLADDRETEGCCAGCGTPYHEETPGCGTCWNRHRNRSRYGVRRAAA